MQVTHGQHGSGHKVAVQRNGQSHHGQMLPQQDIFSLAYFGRVSLPRIGAVGATMLECAGSGEAGSFGRTCPENPRPNPSRL